MNMMIGDTYDMNLTNALQKWGYKDTDTNKRTLRAICKTHSEICSSISPIRIKKNAKKIYLPDKRTKDTYVHIVKAVQGSAHLYPETIDLTEEKLVEQLNQLCSAGIIVKGKNKRLRSTEDYNTTLDTVLWLQKRKYARMAPIVEALERLKPQIGMQINMGQA